MIRLLALILAFAIAPAAANERRGEHADHGDHVDHVGHGERGGRGHESHDHSAHPDAGGQDAAASGAPITRTEEIAAALASGGEPIVVDVLGVVCDFCATAMNKTFGKREEVAAVYVDLDRKTLSLVLRKGRMLTDENVGKLVEKAGYRMAAIRRGDAALVAAAVDGEGEGA